MGEPIFEAINGRTIWRPEEEPLIPAYKITEHSPVSFPDEETARRMHRLIDMATRSNGRHLLSERTVNELLTYAAEMCGEKCVFEGWVVRTEPSIDGLNWDINWRGADHRTKALMGNAVTKLRKSVNLLDF